MEEVTAVQLISVEPSEANAWCAVPSCLSEVESEVELQIGGVSINVLLCNECKDVLLKEIT